MLSKIDYALPIYGLCPASTIKKISTPYHIALRRSLRAFPTTPLKNLYAETGLPTIVDRTIDCTRRLLPKLLFSSNSLLAKDVCNTISRKRQSRFVPVICHTLNLLADLEISLTPRTKISAIRPPWMINTNPHTIKTLQLPKAITPKEKFNALFAKEKAFFSSNGWSFIFTDGSKTSNNTSFAVTNENGDIIRLGILHPICSVFTAELAAILEAVMYAKHKKGKFIICTDSNSCIDAIESPLNDQNEISVIRNTLITSPRKIKLMWTPGHVGIKGNENADTAAKSAAMTPCTMFNYTTKRDILAAIASERHRQLKDDWKTYKNHYSDINPTRTKPNLPADISIPKIKPFIRLRLGHTILTHGHFFLRAPPNKCPFCDELASIKHILVECQNIDKHRHEIFGAIDPLDLLRETSTGNIDKIYKFLKETDLLRRI